MSVCTIPQSSCFTYDALAPGQIRLLRVNSCSGSQIDCSLQHHDLASDRTWFALSYVWGTDEAKHNVRVNGKYIRVKQNLHAALKGVKWAGLIPSEDTETETWIWIDALCINQDDDKEKAVQVQKMNLIFSSAQAVVIWLGKPTRDSKLAFEYFKYVHVEWRIEMIEFVLEAEISTAEDIVRKHRLVEERDSLRRISRRSQTILNVRYDLSVEQLNSVRTLVEDLENKFSGGTHPLSPIDPKDIVDTLLEAPYSLPPLNHPFWDSMFSLLSNEWFRRAWTFQEMYLAKTVVILHNHGMFHFSLIHTFREGLFRRQAIQELWSTTLHSGHDKLSTASLIYYRPPPRLHQRLSLPHLLMNLRTRQGMIGKDYIYCLLGMLDDNTRAAIPVDYALSDAVVLMNAVKLAVSQSPKSLAILWEWYSHTDSVLEGLPSWCPDFTNAMNCFGMRQDNARRASVKVRLKYKRLARVDCEQDATVLGFVGMPLDVVNKAMSASVRLPWDSFLHENRRRDPTRSHEIYARELPYMLRQT